MWIGIKLFNISATKCLFNCEKFVIKGSVVKLIYAEERLLNI